MYLTMFKNPDISLINLSLKRFIFTVFISVIITDIGFAIPASFNIKDYGAKGDGTTLNTKFIQSAIDACAKAGGGTVSFPSGRFISGTIFLKSNVTLCLEPGAILEGSKKIEDYPLTISKIRNYTDNYTNKSLIYGEELENIAITGLGTIDGNGASFKIKDEMWEKARVDSSILFETYKARPYIIRIINCRNILVRDITILNSPMWVQHYLACEDLNIEGITVNSRVNNNNDGIDIDACNRVRISNCDIISGDDAVVLKATTDRPCQNVTVTNCNISSNCNGFKLGTESNGGFKNITFSNSTIYDNRLGAIEIQMVDGGSNERVSISNITMNNVGAAIFIRLGNRARPFKKDMPKPGMGKLSDVIISNVQAYDVGNIGCSITGLPSFPVKNVTLENIRITFKGGGKKELAAIEVPEHPQKYPGFAMFGRLPSYGFFCRHVENLTFNDVELNFTDPDERPAIICDDVDGLEFYKIKTMFSGKEPSLKFSNVKNALIQSCIAPEGIDTYLNFKGIKSKHITIIGNDLSGAKNAIKAEDGIEVYQDANRLK